VSLPPYLKVTTEEERRSVHLLILSPMYFGEHDIRGSHLSFHQPNERCVLPSLVLTQRTSSHIGDPPAAVTIINE
jgi:hypothetical protein